MEIKEINCKVCNHLLNVNKKMFMWQGLAIWLLA